MTTTRIIIVDKDDKIIGYKQRGSLEKQDIYRVSALWLTNSKGNILLAKRHHTKSHHPNKWGPAVAGTVDEGETYKANIIKATEEEIGFTDIEPKLGPKTDHFTQWHTLNIDRDINEFTIQEDEVEEVKWFPQEELKKQLQEHPEKFLPTMQKYFKLFLPKS